MTEIDWGEVAGNYERFPLFRLEKGETKNVIIVDNGKLIPKELLKQAKTKFPKDSYVFLLEEDGKKYEFWLNTRAFSVLAQLKSIRENHNNNLEGIRVKISRISDDPKQTNFKFEEI